MVIALSPTGGSTEGGTVLTITGTGFHPGATVTIDRMRLPAEVQNSTTIQVTTPPHAEAQVDVVVTNPDGQADWPSGGYVYLVPAALD